MLWGGLQSPSVCAGDQDLPLSFLRSCSGPAHSQGDAQAVSEPPLGYEPCGPGVMLRWR